MHVFFSLVAHSVGVFCGVDIIFSQHSAEIYSLLENAVLLHEMWLHFLSSLFVLKSPLAAQSQNGNTKLCPPS